MVTNIHRHGWDKFYYIDHKGVKFKLELLSTISELNSYAYLPDVCIHRLSGNYSYYWYASEQEFDGKMKPDDLIIHKACKLWLENNLGLNIKEFLDIVLKGEN